MEPASKEGYHTDNAVGAGTIAAIYKDRWQIELFFKVLKQNLKIKTSTA